MTLQQQAPQLIVACLCADWCGTCREYKPLFDTLALKFANIRFLWVDVETEADLIDPIEVQNFPTILIATAKNPLFFGTILPHIETLERLIQVKAMAGDNAPIKDQNVFGLVAKLFSQEKDEFNHEVRRT